MYRHTDIPNHSSATIGGHCEVNPNYRRNGGLKGYQRDIPVAIIILPLHDDLVVSFLALTSYVVRLGHGAGFSSI